MNTVKSHQNDGKKTPSPFCIEFFWGFAEMNPQKNPHVSIQKITPGFVGTPLGVGRSIAEI